MNWFKQMAVFGELWNLFWKKPSLQKYPLGSSRMVIKGTAYDTLKPNGTKYK